MSISLSGEVPCWNDGAVFGKGREADSVVIQVDCGNASLPAMVAEVVVLCPCNSEAKSG